MTTFTGKLLEYPFMSIDCFNKENLSSSIYFLSHCHKDHLEGLLDKKFLQRLKSGSPNVNLYVSETTRTLMSCDYEMTKLMDFVIGLPVNQAHHLNVKVENQNRTKEENIVVTLISAAHCVGSVMFLFEGKNGKVLYTGDFRLNGESMKKIPCLHTSSSVAHIKSVYVDTTFCCPRIPVLPTRAETKIALIDIIGKWIKNGSHYVVHLKCKGKYGYEYIMKEVAKHFKMKIHVNEWRLKMSAKLPNMLKHFTTNPNETQIHSCYFGMESHSSCNKLPCDLRAINDKPIELITIVPSSLYFVQTKKLPKDGKLWVSKQKLWRVFHSMHASYDEIREVVGYLKPENIYPCVPPVDCGNIVEAYNRLCDLQRSDNREDPTYEQSCESLEEHDETKVMNEEVPKMKRRLSKDEGCWMKDLRNPHSLSPGSSSRYCEATGILNDSDDRILRSPPPMRKRQKKLVLDNVNISGESMETKTTPTKEEGKNEEENHQICVIPETAPEDLSVNPVISSIRPNTPSVSGPKENQGEGNPPSKDIDYSLESSLGFNTRSGKDNECLFSKDIEGNDITFVEDKVCKIIPVTDQGFFSSKDVTNEILVESCITVESIPATDNLEKSTPLLHCTQETSEVQKVNVSRDNDEISVESNTAEIIPATDSLEKNTSLLNFLQEGNERELYRDKKNLRDTELRENANSDCMFVPGREILEENILRNSNKAIIISDDDDDGDGDEKVSDCESDSTLTFSEVSEASQEF